jgi:uroporphyrinogen decarboxylase
MELLSDRVAPDWEAFMACLKRQGTPRRVHNIELFLDPEVQEAICERYQLLRELDRGDAHFDLRRQIVLQRFLGYDYVRCSLDDFELAIRHVTAADTASLTRAGGRDFVDEHVGPITTWAEFESYPWPEVGAAPTRSLEWYERNLPDDMCVVGSGGFAHFAEYLSWLMGYETLCVALFEQRDLVQALADKLTTMYVDFLERLLEFERVKVIWGSDDMGFRSGPLISPEDLRAFVLPGHKTMATMSHAAGRPYLLHCCGKIDSIMDDLLDDVQIDAKHSFEDTIELVTEAKRAYGDRIAVLGGIDLDFLCRSSEADVRARVRATLGVCQPGGGYCLGTGNSVANYVPLENYLAMLDEGRRFSAGS